MVLRTLVVTSLLCVAVGACTERPFEQPAYGLDDGAQVLITIAADSYAPGALVEFAVDNRGDATYVWNPCTRSREGQTTSGWVRVDEGDRVCTLEGWVLRPGQRTRATTDLPASLPPGEYRLRYGFGRTAGEYSVSDQQVSNSFSVMR